MQRPRTLEALPQFSGSADSAGPPQRNARFLLTALAFQVDECSTAGLLSNGATEPCLPASVLPPPCRPALPQRVAIAAQPRLLTQIPVGLVSSRPVGPFCAPALLLLLIMLKPGVVPLY